MASFLEFSLTRSKSPVVRGHRSKGCLTCRRRKVKCDERRPVCERCEKGFHKCLGYDKPLIFVCQNSQNDGRGDARLHSHEVAAGKAERCSWTQTWTNYSPLGAQGVAPALHLNAFRDEIVISHLLAKFQDEFVGKFPQGTDAPTISGVLTAGNSKSNAYVAGLSLAMAFFGRVQKVKALVEHSSMLYGQALGSLRSDLQLIDKDVARYKAYTNLWACVFLGLYELVYSTNASNWVQHSQGTAALAQLLGPEAFQTPLANAMLETFRSFIAIGDLIHRRHCFLAQPEWQIIPWATGTSEKSLGARQLDILCESPGLAEEADNLDKAAALGHDMSEGRAILQSEISARIQRLARLLWQWELANPMVCCEKPLDVTNSVSFDENGHPLFDTVLAFDKFRRAIESVYFDAIRLLLYTLSDQVGLSDSDAAAMVGSEQSQGPHSNPLLLPGQGTRFKHALQICRTADYFYEKRTDSQGALILLFPLRVAHMHLKEANPRLAAWTERILVGFSSAKGFRIGERVLGMGN